MINATPHQVERLLALADQRRGDLPDVPATEAEEDVLTTINAARSGAPVSTHEVENAITYIETLR